MKPKKFKLKANSIQRWIRITSGLFGLHPNHVKFVTVMLIHMYKEDKDVVDREVREFMRKAHGVTEMHGIYRILTKLRKAGIVDKNNRLHAMLRLRNRISITFEYEREE